MEMVLYKLVKSFWEGEPPYDVWGHWTFKSYMVVKTAMRMCRKRQGEVGDGGTEIDLVLKNFWPCESDTCGGEFYMRKRRTLMLGGHEYWVSLAFWHFRALLVMCRGSHSWKTYSKSWFRCK